MNRSERPTSTDSPSRRWPLRLLIAIPAWLCRMIAALFRHREREPELRQPVSGILRAPRLAALVMISVLVGAASLVSFAESYRGLYDWASRHDLYGGWAAIWPLQVDVFIAVGELALFVGLVDGWRRRSRGGAWLVTLAGLAVSVAGNVGHVSNHMFWDRATAAVPPIAAAAALAVGLGVLKRVVEHHHERAAAAKSEPEQQLSAPRWTDAQTAAIDAQIRATEAGNPYKANALGSKFRLSRAEATKVVETVESMTTPLPSLNGNGPHA